MSIKKDKKTDPEPVWRDIGEPHVPDSSSQDGTHVIPLIQEIGDISDLIAGFVRILEGKEDVRLRRT